MKNNSLEQFMQKFSVRLDVTSLHHIEESISKEIAIIPEKIDLSTLNTKCEEIKNHIKKIEIEWDNKPIDFLQRDHVRRYMDVFLDTISFIEKLKNKIFESYLADLQYHFSQKGYLIYLLSSYFIIGFILTIIFAFNTHLNDSKKMFVAIISMIIAVILTNRRERKKAKSFDVSSSKEYQQALEDINKKISRFKERMEIGSGEMFANADFNQSLLNQIKSRQIDAHFNEQESKQLLLDRMEIMKLEIEKAREMAKDMTEQHRITEEMRIKYAREMMELEQQLKAQSDRDLYEKMEILKKMMGG